MALSTYMCAPDKLAAEATNSNKATPVFIGHGSQDPVVPLAAGQQAFHALKNQGFNVSWHDYRMEHSVCAQEVADISSFLQRRLMQAKDN